ncbi:hypothetical protein [Salmonirosea aquatica]|uniref:hypothetical protein n=1 Tax=Salmonirosea aquatica TaxID=2654236 RepID=UPI003570B204
MLFSNLTQIGIPNAIFCGGFIFLGIYAYTELMDRNPNAWLWETAKNGLGLGILFYLGDWFGVPSAGNWMSYVVGTYFVIATLVTLGFTILDIKKKPAPERKRVMEYAQ